MNPITLYINADVVSMDAGNRRCQALATGDGRILALGSNEEIKSLATAGSKTVDLGGRTVLPGFIDPHGHFLLSCYYKRFFVDLSSPPVGDVTCMDDILKKMKKKAGVIPPGEWISGFGYDDTLLAEKRHPNRYDLDKVSNDHPIEIRHVSGHALAANSKALELAGVNRDTSQPMGGHIQIDPSNGEPLGVMEELSAMSLVVKNLMSVVNPEKVVEAILHGSRRYLAAGTTTAQDGLAFPPFLEIFLSTARGGQLKNRVHVLPAGGFPLDQYRTTAAGSDLSGNNMVSMGAVKLIQDGSIQIYTACLSQPYYILPQDRPDLAFNYHGYRVNDPLIFEEQIIALHKKGYQIAIHANGDMAIDDCLNGFEAAQKVYPRNDARHIIIHCQTAREDQLDRIKRLGVVPSFFACHTYYWGDRHEAQFLGPSRARHIDPCRSALVRNIPFTNHNDDFVTPINPLLSIWSAANRISSSGRVIGADQRVPVLEAIKSVTTYAAYQNHEERLKGSLEPGKLADMVVLAENPLEIDPVKIKDIEVLATIVGDEVVYGKL